jgi:ArsR family transcriptional regulator
LDDCLKPDIIKAMTNITLETFYRLLGDPTRLRCLQLLASQGELCVCELTTALDAIQPKISRHLATLREAGIVSDRRAGQWIYYRLHPELADWQLQTLQLSLQAHSEDYSADQTRLLTMKDRPGKSCQP